MIQNNFPQQPSPAIQEKIVSATIDIQKQQCIESIRTEAYQNRTQSKLWLQSIENEHKRHEYHKLELSPDGSIVEYQALAGPDAQRSTICNICHPVIIRLLHYNNMDEECWQLNALVNGNSISIFLNPSKIASVAYIQQKFCAKGVTFFTNSFARKREFSLELLRWLIQQPYVQTKIIYDIPGWHQDANNTFTFISQEEMTWKQLLQKTQ